MVREFMAGLSGNWSSFPSALRNRFMKCLIDRVEIRGDKDIEATICWKAGFQQSVIIQRQRVEKSLKQPWTDAEYIVLKRLYQLSSVRDVMADLPGRSWRGIKNKAERLHLKREHRRQRSSSYRLWTAEEDNNLKLKYEKGTKVAMIAMDLGRSVEAVQIRAAKLKLMRSNPVSSKSGEDNNPMFLQQSSSPCAAREEVT
jgi:hypothetical protein